MPKRARKSKDINQLAAAILVDVVGEPAPILPEGKKNPAAVPLGRKGGVKRSKAKAPGRSPAKRVAISKKAAAPRRKAK
jgi:hypothetical protein